MSDYMPKCATCEHFESCIMQKHITEMALILWNISREKEKERTVNKPRRKRGRVMAEIIVDVGDNLVETIGCEYSGELVRCKECVYCKRKNGTFKGEPITFCHCEENNRDVESDDYCSWAERSE